MCNPRRVRVQATRKIAEAWRAEIERAATAHTDVSSEARLVQLITDLLPPPARTAFEQAMRVAPDWVWTDGEYRKELPGGYTAYRPDTGELEIVVRLTVAIEAVGSATLVASGEVVDEVTAEATGTYYTDNYGGMTQESARAQARRAAEAQADELAERRKEVLKHQAEEAARLELGRRTGEAEAQARVSAERQLTLKAEGLRSDLDERASAELDAVQTETLKGIFQLVAAGYSAALQAYAQEYGENLRVVEDEGVIRIEFEVER
jgi:hypothetical protein